MPSSEHRLGLVAGAASATGRAAPEAERGVFDPLNRRIFEMLRDDGRRSFSEIAGVLGVSEGTIRNRVNAMRRDGQMRIVALVDPVVAEYETDAMLGITVAAGTSPSAVAERLGRSPEVVYILWVSGRFDLLVEVVADERDALLGFLEAHVHNQPDIASVETMTGLKNFKNQFLLKREWEGVSDGSI